MDIDQEYLVLQSKYHQLHSKEKDLFPNEWYRVKEYGLKKAILKDCLKNNYLIRESSLYSQLRFLALNKKG